MALTVNQILTSEITKLNHTLIPPNFNGSSHNLRAVRGQVADMIDRLGHHSAAAQGLSKVITTTEKVIQNESFIIYIMKDAYANNGNGEAIGLLKIGRKHLYLNDPAAKMHEIEPWCILDFFIEPNYQRHGLGKKLIDHMLEDINTPIKNFAIDGPSQSMLRFLAKNYGLDNIVIQPNNFALSDDFFEHLDEIRAASGNVTPSIAAAGAGRFTAAQPRSAIATVIHGGSPTSVAPRASREEEEYPLPNWDDEEVNYYVQPPPSDEPEDWDAEMAAEARERELAEERDRELAEERARAAERPSTLPVEPAGAEPATPAPEASPAAGVSSRRDSQLTDKGYFDVKFYHNKLW